jgi:predicted nucleic acid-binding protein
LSAYTAIYIDTALFIYFIERHPIYLSQVREVFRMIDENDLIGFSSILILTEVLSHPMKRGDVQMENQYREILTRSEGVEVIPVSLAIAERAAELRARYNLRTPDAIHVATALVSKCDAFLTNDSTLKRVIEIPILVIDELTLEEDKE